ncbi:MAG TPA: hypothetical protein VER33_22770 [Polyangiaceae bacterium]|nr:hypothetical protein [Polyangiaceae bacterium]
MFVGHFGLALASKRVTPHLNVGILMLAAQTLDVVWPLLVLSRLEAVSIDPSNTPANPLVFEHYPYSHSLLAALLWGMAFALVARLAKASTREAAVLAALVVSHWALDWLMHVPDLPLGLGAGRKFGLGLWQSVPASIAIELGFLACGAWLYFRQTRARNTAGRVAMPALLLMLGLIQLASFLGPPPPSADAVAISALGMWLFFAIAFWADRQRDRLASPPR